MSHPDDMAPADGEIRRTATITNQRGLHARASAKFVKLVATFDAEISVRRGESVVSGESIMGLMMLAAGPGTSVELRASGAQADAAMDALLDLINRKFDEE
ncbi:HPr family phosphocarrier protein [Azospirillum sp. 412522]|nr:HPr family phosphocarrier protein [Azospirillum sp. 412522]MBY6264757.1 HPr family phosphocarrier protein [Azospirillum sp. 412522]